MDKSKIAFFDSGVGGLTVYKEVKKLLPNEDYLYFGDTINMPYGEKTQKELIEIARKIFDFFAEREVKAVVMACNTTSAMTYDVLKNDYDFKIYPIIQSVAKVISKLPIEHLGVFATPATINSHAYAREINKLNPSLEVTEISCPAWVRIVEENRLNQPQSLLQIKERVEEMLTHNPQKIVLGCTHYPYLKGIIKQFYPEENLIDPSKYFAEFIKEDLTANPNGNEKQYSATSASLTREPRVAALSHTPLKSLDSETFSGSEHFYVSSNPENFMAASKLFCELSETPELVKL